MTTKIKPSKKKIAFILFLIFSGLWFAGAIGFYFIYQPISKNDTTEYTVTINKIQPITFYTITTNEHNARFLIFSEEVVKDIDSLNDLNVGQEITIRIKNADINKLSDTNELIYLVSLNVNGKEIITIESYNDNNAKSQFESCLGFSIAGILCSIISVVLFIINKKDIVK